MVGPVKVGDHEVEKLCAEVVWYPKLDRQHYVAEGY